MGGQKRKSARNNKNGSEKQGVAIEKNKKIYSKNKKGGGAKVCVCFFRGCLWYIFVFLLFCMM